MSRLTPLALALAVAGCSSPASTGNAIDESHSAEVTTDIAATQAAGVPGDARATSTGDAITADTPVTSENYAQVMEARSREYEGLKYKPVTLNGFTAGDNIYLELTRGVEGAAPETVLCTARLCADWRDAGALPAGLRNKGATAKFGTADQVDGSGKVMKRGVEAVVELRLRAGLRRTSAKASTGDTGPLPLTRGVFVAEGSDCKQPANAAIRVWNGTGLSGSATRNCRPTIRSRDGDTYRLSNSCENTYDGSRTAAVQTITVNDKSHFALREEGEASAQRFRLCPAGEAPDALEKLVR